MQSSNAEIGPCPKCGSTLEGVSYAGVVVDRCAGCRGIWFDGSELERLLEAKGAGAAIDIGDPKQGAKYDSVDAIPCPRGHVPKMIRMVDHEQTHVWYERCPVCSGTWLDAGEFSDLEQDTIMDFFRDLFRRERR